MNEEIKKRIAKIHELVQRGATDGEKAAASKALGRLMEKYNLEASELELIEYKDYRFTYSWLLEVKLLERLLHHFIEDHKGGEFCRYTVIIPLKYIDYVTLDSAYEYFRRHMKAQWDKTCGKIVSRCRKPKTKKRKRQELEPVFLSQYIIKSNLIDRKHIKKIDPETMTDAGFKKLMATMGIEGGQYSTQVQTAHMLEAGTAPLPKSKSQLAFF